MWCYYYYSHRTDPWATADTYTLPSLKNKRKKQAQQCARFACHTSLMSAMLD